MSSASKSARKVSAPALPATVWLVSWVSCLADISSEMIYPLLPLFLISVLHASKAQLGAIEGGAVLLVAIVSAYSGWKSDQAGKRTMWIRIGYGLPVLGKAIIAAAGSWGVVFGGRLVDRMGKGMRGSPRDALIADAVTADQRGRAFGLHRAFDTAGALVGVMLSAVLLWWLAGTPRVEAPSTNGAVSAWVYRVIFGIGAASPSLFLC